jgi:chemotaxis protein MotB
MALIVSGVGVACVPARKYEDCRSSLVQYQASNFQLKSSQEQLLEQIAGCEAQMRILERDVEWLRRDTAQLRNTLQLEIQKNTQLNQTYDLLLQKNKELLADNRYQTEKISVELLRTQEQLIRKEDELKKLEADLRILQQELTMKATTLNEAEQQLQRSVVEVNASRQNLQASQQELEGARQELDIQQAKLMDLQRVLAEKDSVVAALRTTVSNALLGFVDQGLKVEERNGKVYVSMDNKLLFASGSTAVGAGGRGALVELARVLEANPDINVLVEGHTDDQPLRGSGHMTDNWDLSVLRATAIVRIILDNGNIAPARITAAGRSEYLPVDPASTPEARARNRRTEIILTPRLDELFRVIESN